MQSEGFICYRQAAGEGGGAICSDIGENPYHYESDLISTTANHNDGKAGTSAWITRRGKQTTAQG